jgi:hypothetical protein
MRSVSFSLGNLLKAALSSGLVVLFTTCVLAGPLKQVRVTGSGGVTGLASCPGTEFGLETSVTGTATHIGRFVGALSECIHTDGTYSGTGVFTTPDGSTILTKYSGHQMPPDQNGQISFAETYHILGGTRKYAHASGELEVDGVADMASGRFQITGDGTLSY